MKTRAVHRCLACIVATHVHQDTARTILVPNPDDTGQLVALHEIARCKEEAHCDTCGRITHTQISWRA